MFKGIIDVTLRDGQQSPLLFDSYKYHFSLSDKIKLIDGLINLGVTRIEFFSPVVSDSERRDFIKIKEYIRGSFSKKILLLAHCRCYMVDIDEAARAGFDGLNLYMNGNALSHKYNYRKRKHEIISHIVETVKKTRAKYPNLYLRFSIEDAFRTPLKTLHMIFDKLYPFVNTFGIPDTVGVATPETVRKNVGSLKKKYPKADFECHFHNDRGFALINTIAAIQAGITYADTSIWGLAERSGIASTTGVLLNLNQIDKKYTKEYNLDLCYPLNALMGSILKMQVPYNEPVSITNRTHIAGVHHKAVLNLAKIYEAHQLEQFGVTKNQLLLGPLSGWNLIYYYLKEFEYLDISELQAKEISQEFKSKSKKIGRRLRPEVLLKQIAAKHKLAKIPTQNKYLDKRVENLN